MSLTRHLVAYTANTNSGIATVITDQPRPTVAECAEQIPGFVSGRSLGPAPMYTLRYTVDGAPVTRVLDAAGVERIGKVVTRLADRRDTIGNIEVLDAAGGDVTFDFACFRD